MTDAVLQIRPETGTIDFSIAPNGDIERGDFFDSLLLVAIYEERRASSSEVPSPELRRGWIGNEATPNFERGSKIWLYEQSRLTRTVINNIIAAADESLNEIVKLGFAKRITSDVEIVEGQVALSINIEREQGKTETTFFPLWDNSGNTDLRNF